MTGLDVSAIAALLREFAQRNALRRDNPFRAKAYARAADNLRTLTLPLDRLIAEERLREVPGVGKAIADIVKTLHATGTHPALEKMRKELPGGDQELGLSSLAELEEAAREDRLRKIKGFGASLQSKILRGIEMQRAAQGRWHMRRASELLNVAEKHLRDPRSFGSPAGDFRRGCELVLNLSLVTEVRHLRNSQQTLPTGMELTARLTDAARYGVTLMLATGSDARIWRTCAPLRRSGA